MVRGIRNRIIIIIEIKIVKIDILPKMISIEENQPMCLPKVMEVEALLVIMAVGSTIGITTITGSNSIAIVNILIHEGKSTFI